MAQVVVNGKKQEVVDGTPLVEVAKQQLGIPINCSDGMCGVCYVQVESGQQNLTEPTEAEQFFGLRGKDRLACQCTVRSGVVKLKYE